MYRGIKISSLIDAYEKEEYYNHVRIITDEELKIHEQIEFVYMDCIYWCCVEEQTDDNRYVVFVEATES